MRTNLDELVDRATERNVLAERSRPTAAAMAAVADGVEGGSVVVGSVRFQRNAV